MIDLQRPRIQRAGPAALLAVLAWIHATALAAASTGTIGVAMPAGPSTPAGAPAAGAGPGPTVAPQDDDLEELLEEYRADLDLSRRRGEWTGVLAELDELLAEDAGDWASRAIRARLLRDQGEHTGALSEARRAYRDAQRLGVRGSEWQLAAHCVELDTLAELGLADQAAGAVAALESAGFDLGADPRADRSAGDLWLEAGERERAFERFEAGARAPAESWDQHLDAGRCMRRLGDLVGASTALVNAAQGRRPEPEALAELADLYFEADGEVSRAPAARNPGPLFKKARSTNPKSQAALLGLYELYRFNWKRQSFEADEFLGELLDARPSSIDGLLADARTAVDFGQLRHARERLAELRALAPGRRDVRALEAALAYIDNERERSSELLAALAEQDARDSEPEQRLGKHLVELYRFSEALPFLEAAVERDPNDYQAWTDLGRARGNTADVEGALEAFEKAEFAAAGRTNAVRENLTQVLQRIRSRFVEEQFGALTFAWQPEGSEVLAAYLPAFYERARAELVDRYAFATGDVRIEVFERHGDFSVRSTGFEGFPALGVCFGPVVTAVSPLSELRGNFSWARTGFHEFTHVVHLGLSHNRCPRWITEGLATWEEQRKNPAWQRNMRQDLLDARANGQIIPLRELNRAFRGPRVLFGYYQGGLLCAMLIEDFGFPPMVAFLEAFDRGLDLDAAVAEVFETTPEEIDRRFHALVDQQLDGLHVEPRWNPQVTAVQRLTLDRDPPRDPDSRTRWADDWISVAFGDLQSGSRVDAEEALRRLESELGEELPARVHHLRGALALDRSQPSTAAGHFQAFLEAGGEDFQVRLFLAERAFGDGDLDQAEAHLVLAEQAFPGFPQVERSAELALARLYDERGQGTQAMAAKERWCAYNASNLELRLQVARWHQIEGRAAEAERLLSEANDIDPFRGRLHLDWSAVLRDLDRPEEALRELRVALKVPAGLDADPGPLAEPDGRLEVLRSAADLALELGRAAEAREFAREALLLRPGDGEAAALLRRAEAALAPGEATEGSDER